MDKIPMIKNSQKNPWDQKICSIYGGVQSMRFELRRVHCIIICASSWIFTFQALPFLMESRPEFEYGPKEDPQPLARLDCEIDDISETGKSTSSSTHQPFSPNLSETEDTGDPGK